jgi:hypothetical protein
LTREPAYTRQDDAKADIDDGLRVHLGRPCHLKLPQSRDSFLGYF